MVQRTWAAHEPGPVSLHLQLLPPLPEPRGHRAATTGPWH